MRNIIGGYQYSFVDTLHERYICKVCHLPSRDPYLSVCCGHIFCKTCLSDVKTVTAITNTCPVCRDEEFKTFRNKAIDREIKDLHIYCTNKEKGCKWQGKLSDVNDHLGNSVGCRFEEVNCSNECEEKMERRFLTSHVETECPRRKVNCQYCHDTGEHQFIEGQHKEECPKLPLPCPNKCEVGSVPREDMEAHRKECPLKMVKCEYHSMGCEVRMAHKDQKKHESENMKEHLAMTKCELTCTKATLATIDSKLANTDNQLDNAIQRIHILEVLLYFITVLMVYYCITVYYHSILYSCCFLEVFSCLYLEASVATTACLLLKLQYVNMSKHTLIHEATSSTIPTYCKCHKCSSKSKICLCMCILLVPSYMTLSLLSSVML